MSAKGGACRTGVALHVFLVWNYVGVMCSPGPILAGEHRSGAFVVAFPA